MKDMLIVIEVKEKEKEDLLKKLMDTFDFLGYAYLYNKYTKEILLVYKHGFVTFRYNDSYYKSPENGEEFGEMEVILRTTERQMPLLAQEVIRDLIYLGLHEKVKYFYTNVEVV